MAESLINQLGKGKYEAVSAGSFPTGYVVITVCDQAASESCPVFLGEYQTLHWSTTDPAKAEGTGEDIRRAFDDALQMLKRRIENELL
jgi:arsenate reductase